MKLYKPDEGTAGDYIQDYGEEATLDDIKAYLAEQGLVAVHKIALEHVAVGYKALTEVPRYKRIAESLIKAAGEGDL